MQRLNRNLDTPPHDGDHLQHIGFHNLLLGPVGPRQDRAVEFDDHQLGPITEALEEALQGLAGITSALLTVHLHGDGRCLPRRGVRLWAARDWGFRGAQGWLSSWCSNAWVIKAGLAASVRALTTATRVAPAAWTVARLLASMPPIAKKGIGHSWAAAAT